MVVPESKVWIHPSLSYTQAFQPPENCHPSSLPAAQAKFEAK